MQVLIIDCKNSPSKSKVPVHIFLHILVAVQGRPVGMSPQFYAYCKDTNSQILPQYILYFIAMTCLIHCNIHNCEWNLFIWYSSQWGWSIISSCYSASPLFKWISKKKNFHILKICQSWLNTYVFKMLYMIIMN